MTENNLHVVNWDRIPQPIDDGAAKHLQGKLLPSISLVSTSDNLVDLSKAEGVGVVFIYPMTGKPDTPLPPDWDNIPGARGCTLQACSFRDNLQFLKKAGVNSVYGLSVQAPPYQKEAANRLELNYDLLSDEMYRFSNSLELPVMSVGNVTLLRRLSLIIKNGIIIKVFYPIFPPDSDPENVANWLSRNKTLKNPL